MGAPAYVANLRGGDPLWNITRSSSTNRNCLAVHLCVWKAPFDNRDDGGQSAFVWLAVQARPMRPRRARGQKIGA